MYTSSFQIVSFFFTLLVVYTEDGTNERVGGNSNQSFVLEMTDSVFVSVLVNGMYDHQKRVLR